MPQGRRAWITARLGEDQAAAFDVGPGPFWWLVEMLHDAGTCRVEVGMEGTTLLGLGWSDLMAWIDGAGERDLAPVFRRGLMALSAAYAATAMAAREVGCLAPMDPGEG